MNNYWSILKIRQKAIKKQLSLKNNAYLPNFTLYKSTIARHINFY